MRSGVAGAEQFSGFRRDGAPHNPETERVRRLARGGAARFGQRDQMSLCSPLSPWTRVA
jgi:hypothetical protein